MADINFGGPCPECGEPTVTVGAYWPASQPGPDEWRTSCTKCDWTASSSDE